MLAGQDRTVIGPFAAEKNPVSSLDFDIDSQMTRLELEWRHAFEASVLALSDFESMKNSANPDKGRLQQAIDRLERAEAVKAKVMVKIEKLEESLLDS
jgi:hypothetical protein